MSLGRPPSASAQNILRLPLSRQRVQVRPGLQNSARRATPKPRRRAYATLQQEEDKPFTLDAFYADILKAPKTQKVGPPPVDPNNPPKPAVPSSETAGQTVQERARVVFGSRLAGPVERRRELDRKSTVIAGVLVPPRPEEPDNCCMSGCVNCVWDRYRDEIEDWAEKSAEARAEMRKSQSGDGPLSRASADPGSRRQGEVDHTMTSMDDDGGGSEALWSSASSENTAPDYFESIPVGIREFMKTEKKLKQKKAKQST